MDATSASYYKGKTPSLFGAFGVNIPWSGDNSINCEFSKTAITSDDYWSDFDGEKQTQVSVDNEDLNITMSISLDYLDGTHPNMQGEDEYYYTTVVLLQDKPSS